jgi:SAM-dependent methyltransferase
MNELQCCVVSCDKPLDQNYWDNQYQNNTTAWDLGEVSPPIKNYIDTLENKNIRILIPGCGNTHEATYLLEKGFSNITVIDIAPTLVSTLKTKFKDNPNINIILGDFFEHIAVYDAIIEQTFFCALPPSMRQKYVCKMHQLLAKDGKIIGLLFNRTFESGPPFGGSQEEYTLLFNASFNFLKMEICRNSATPRAGSELFIELQKNSEVHVYLHPFEGITCSGCKNTVSEKFTAIKEF